MDLGLLDSPGVPGTAAGEQLATSRSAASRGTGPSSHYI